MKKLAKTEISSGRIDCDYCNERIRKEEKYLKISKGKNRYGTYTYLKYHVSCFIRSVAISLVGLIDLNTLFRMENKEISEMLSELVMERLTDG